LNPRFTDDNTYKTDLSDIVTMVRKTIPAASKKSVFVALLQESNKN